ncbi:MAG TPA: ATP-binding cassette domain-containing protein [Leptospiraceae bacterium]|nr:ATP-binding cassette domain-containing protein [Leptospiraceae bacterium]HRG75524.1 ATP-binding cassette domain-containing protein [Leptospiraceae bacterium]
MNLLEVKNLNIVDKSGREILKNFTFELRKDSIHAIIGESGSGKTTFANSIFHLTHSELCLNFDSYSILGKNYLDYSTKDWENLRGKKITLIPQNPGKSFHPFISIGAQMRDYFRLKFPTLANEVSILEILEQLQIRDPKKSYHSIPKNLSGGEKQRILVAMAIAVKPEIVIADEPTTALDSINEKLTLSLLHSMLKNSGIGLVLITHDMRIVRELADDVTVLKSGELIEKITLLNKNMNKLQSEYSQKLVLK